ncbi:hypothetical protein L1049_009164 [Liquidambar formosana]|uniref:Uncharacterized protein n=1 Tax=Liquidambar formosana TaxID=63359 RepID=A0AAP0S5J4_LIQFO
MFPSSKEMPVMQSEGKYPKGNKLDIKPMNSSIIESYRRLDRETAGLAATKGRNPSPNRRFSIGLGRMSKSLSFKEGSVVPQLSSTYVAVKSGPVSSEASACLDNSNRDKANATNRGRSSPLRRLLDPLLRPKAPNILHSAPETVWPLKGNLNSLSSMPINACESLQNEKHEVSTVHALLQFTINNGVPLFKFAVKNNNNILAATVNNLSTSEKDDSSLDYTFYSVNEIKKKSTGWMNQASKEKSCDYAYNVAGQMKISSPHSPYLTGQNSKNQSMVRESVLFSVEPRHAGQETPKVVPTRELAAIVVNIPSEDLSHDGEQSNKDEKLSEKGFTESLPEERCSCNMGENKISCSTTVILPGGIHGLPNRGIPSPLLARWRGGSCDCGGWDVGCKLCVLCNQDRCCKISGQSKACPIPDRFELFVQGGAQENRPFFSLVPFKKGIYSVEFKASISLLQAFFICVTVMSCQKSSDLSEMSNLFEARLLQEPTLNGDDRSNTPTMVQGKVPAKYAPLPPLSPVGRV